MVEIEDDIITMLDLYNIHKKGIMKAFLEDLQKYYPEAFDDLKETIEKMEKRKKLAQLFKK